MDSIERCFRRRDRFRRSDAGSRASDASQSVLATRRSPAPQRCGLRCHGERRRFEIIFTRIKEAMIPMTNDIRGAQLSTPSGKPLRGLYPILETPFTPDDV